MRRIWAIVLALLLGIAPFSAAYADDAKGHWKDICLVLFNDQDYYKNTTTNSKEDTAIKALLYASQLCIDLFDNNNNNWNWQDFKKLSAQFKTIGLPSKLSDIMLKSSSNNHRAYTHQGWSFDYQKYDDGRNPDWSSVRWPKRKKLLLNTAEAIFDFNGAPRFLNRFLGTNQKCDAFCRLLYCVHILGDYKECKSRKQYEQSKKEMMPLAALRGDSILSELNACLPILFPKQNTSALKKELKLIESEARSLINLSNDCSTDEAAKQYAELATKTRDVLSEHLPRLLKNEAFFSKIFYS